MPSSVVASSSQVNVYVLGKTFLLLARELCINAPAIGTAGLAGGRSGPELGVGGSCAGTGASAGSKGGLRGSREPDSLVFSGLNAACPWSVPGRCRGSHGGKQAPSVHCLGSTARGRCPGAGRTPMGGAGASLACSAFPGAFPRGVCSVASGSLLGVTHHPLHVCFKDQSAAG